MATQDVVKSIDRELQAIESEFDAEGWNFCDPEDLGPVEAYNRGYYRALQSVKSSLTEDE